MKKNLIIAALTIMAFNLNAQFDFQFGDIELETDLNEISAKAELDFGAFIVDMATTYDVEEKKIEYMEVDLKMEPAEIYLALEIGRITNNSIDLVLETYTEHKAKGWGFIAKQLGIKPGSDKFHSLKNSVSKSSYIPTSKGNTGKEKKKGKNKGKK